MWGVRVIIPIKLRNKVLDELHEGHLGIVKMKELSRSFFWWPQLGNDIEQLARKCLGCQVHQKAPPKVSSHPWEWPSAPWELRWTIYGAYVLHRGRCTFKLARGTSNELHYGFKNDRHIKTNLISDNGRTFTSEEFQTFCRNNGIIHKTSAPWHPATQGLVERFVQTFKLAMKSASTDGGSLHQKINTTCNNERKSSKTFSR